jgi:bla regulator protein blaR1
MSTSGPVAPYYPEAAEVPADLPHLIARGVSTSVATATAAISPQVVKSPEPFVRAVAPSGATVESSDGTTVARGPDGSTVTMYPPDRQGRRRVVAIAASGATAVSYADADDDDDANAATRMRRRRDSAIDDAIEMKAVGLTPEYAAAIRAASPPLRYATLNQILQLKAVGVTPDYVREIARAGFTNLGAAELQEARAIGLTPDYMRAIRATGVPVTLNDLIELRAMGVRPDELARVRGAGPLTIDKIHEMRRGPRPPQPPRPPEPPSDDSDGG